jgi:phosphate transport system protein
MLSEQIIILKKRLVEYATIVEQMIGKSMRGLTRKEMVLLDEVIEKDEEVANRLEMEMDELCINLIAQYQPKARDLRTILMGFTMSSDFERMGDHAVNIALNGIYLIERPPVKPLIDIPKMAEEVSGMLRNCITAFIEEDVKLARSVCMRDSVVDALRDQILRELITYMVSDSSTIERAICLMTISRNLERIADLSTNISEDVIFMVEGKNIKHHHEES